MHVRDTWLQSAIRSPQFTGAARSGLAAHFHLTAEELGPSLKALETRLEQTLMAPMRDMGFLVTSVRLDVGAKPRSDDSPAASFTSDGGLPFSFTAMVDIMQLDRDYVSGIRKVPELVASAIHSA